MSLLIISLLSATKVKANPPEGLGANELLVFAEKAYNEKNWQAAADSFKKFIESFGGLPETKNAVARVKPLLATALVRLEQYEEALPILTEVLESKDLPPAQRIDMLFFGGLASMQTGDQTTARKHFGAIFSNPKVDQKRRMESLMLGGTSYIVEENWEEAASFFKKHVPDLLEHDPKTGTKAKLLQLHALTQLESWDEAIAIIQSVHQNLEHTHKIVTFSAQLIQISTHFLEEGEFYKAIQLLRLVPTTSEIQTLLNQRLSETEKLLEVTSASNKRQTTELTRVIDEIKGELETLSGFKQFDSASRLRLASAYFQLGRTREACLILDQMVRQMEPDAVVESATASLIRGWMSLERFARAERTADLYLERLAGLEERPNLSDILFLKAQALEGRNEFVEAATAYRETAEKFPNKPIADKARFMEAYSILQLERYPEAASLFKTQLDKKRPTDSMWEDFTYWRGMAIYFQDDWGTAREIFQNYIETAETSGISGEYIDDSMFRIGYSHFSEADYPKAIEILDELKKTYPESEWLPEALLALGDSHGALGDLDKADQVYKEISVEAPGFHDEAWMKRGNILKMRKDFEGMKQLFEEFISNRSASPRIAEGLYWLAWVAKKENKPEQARKIYLDTISKYGNDTVRPGLEDILIGLQDLYSGDEKYELLTQLKTQRSLASATGKNRLATRLTWAIAQLQLGMKSLPEQQRITGARLELVSLAGNVDPKETAPRILADLADALETDNKLDLAYQTYEDLRKWWPRSPFRDRAFAGKAFIELERGDEAAAIDSFEKFEKYSLMPKSATDENGLSIVESELGGRVALAKAKLLETRNPPKALNTLLAVQKNKAMPASVRADALLATGNYYASRKSEREALPYFEQVYLLFNRYPEKVATAYFQRAKALENLGLPEKARQVYSELATRPDLASFETAKLARQRATQLGGVIQPLDSSVGTVNPPTPDE
ncbi:MAG: tetratricopeptide repeat protein [Akkermansiaceae bacterium]